MTIVWSKLKSCAGSLLSDEALWMLPGSVVFPLNKLFNAEPQPGQKVACCTKAVPQRGHVMGWVG